MKTLAILVGGGPAPGINAVIAAATIEAKNHGLRVLGCLEGYRHLMRGDRTHVRELGIDDVSRIHFDGGSVLRTARANPTTSAENLRRTVETLRELEVDGLLTIGGDDTALGAARISETAGGAISVIHVPKTIDNDLPLPPNVPTFGFTTAVEVGTLLVRNLMEDAATSGKWFFITVMGRHAGHLALAIGGAAGATLSVISEEFPEPTISLDKLADIMEGAIIKRLSQGRDHGLAVLAEGLAEKLAPDTLGAVERDAYGNIRLSELEISRLVKERVTARMGERDLHVSIVAKDIGYELRCEPPRGFDIQYCRALGYWATRLLLEKKSRLMATIQGGNLVPIPFDEMISPDTGRVSVRYVDVESEAYRTLAAYMIRLKREDFDTPERIARLAEAGHMGPEEFVKRFGHLVGAGEGA